MIATACGLGALAALVTAVAPRRRRMLVVRRHGPRGVGWRSRWWPRVLASSDRDSQRLRRQLAPLAESMARQARVGRSTVQAFADVGRQCEPPLRHDLGTIVARVRRGRSVVEELQRWVDDRQLMELRMVVTALVVGESEGGGRARALDAVAASLRDREAIERELRAQTAQARLSAVVVAAIPPVFTAVLMAAGAVSVPATGRRWVLAAIGAGLALDAVGLWWMRRLTEVRW